jgi:hypothetical protein
MTSTAALSALGVAVNRITAAAGLARAVADHVPDYDEGGKLDCLDAIELHLLRPAALDLQAAYEKAREAIERARHEHERTLPKPRRPTRPRCDLETTVRALQGIFWALKMLVIPRAPTSRGRFRRLVKGAIE